MSKQNLITDNNFDNGDAFYAELTEAHRDINSQQSERLNARLVLLLANHIGAGTVLSEAIKIASDVTTEASPSIQKSAE